MIRALKTQYSQCPAILIRRPAYACILLLIAFGAIFGELTIGNDTATTLSEEWTNE
ncbi:MAG: hypothetical protein GF344_07285, partial [Chitinivibrionales bacterium]|nr:hypothetical protein [Chitinivibrionales bacterium]MBD3356712.1 hypothetical protein [Chitinivibrionales bacterium]